MRRSVLFLSAWLAVFAAPELASAALTDSEKAQIRDFYAEGDAEKAARTRALLARPDLSPAEIREAFAGAARAVPFDDERRRFVHGLLFGPASKASRSELLGPIVEGLLARAQRVAGASGSDADRARELLSIHRFVADIVAPSAADPGGGQGAAPIRSDALEAVIRSYQAHLALPAMEKGALSPTMLTARVQAELAVVALASSGSSIADVAGWVTPNADARRTLARSGVLVHGLDGASPSMARAVSELVERFPLAAAGTSMVWVAKPWPRGLSSGGAILVAQADLASGISRDSLSLWPASIEPAAVDAALAEVAFVLARRGVAARLRQDTAFDASAQRALARAKRQGEAGFLGLALVAGVMAEPSAPAVGASATSIATSEAISTVGFLAHAVQLVQLDAPRALAAALSRAAVGRFEPIEQLALAIGVLAQDANGKPLPAATAGKPDAGGGLAAVPVTDLSGTGDRIDGFTLPGQVVRLTRTSDGAVTGVTVNGAAPVAGKIPLAKTPTTPGDRWAAPAGSGVGVALFERLAGRAELGFPGGGRVVLRSGGKSAAAAIAPTGASEMRLQADVMAFTNKSEIVLRAQKGDRAPTGVVVSLGGGAAPSARVFARDEAGREQPLGPPIELPKDTSRPIQISATLLRDRVSLTIAGKKLDVALPPSAAAPAHLPTQLGDVAFSVPPGGEIVLGGLSISGLPPGG